MRTRTTPNTDTFNALTDTSTNSKNHLSPTKILERYEKERNIEHDNFTQFSLFQKVLVKNALCSTKIWSIKSPIKQVNDMRK